MVKKLKVDFHVHSGEDPKDQFIRYSAKGLLDKAAEYHFDAITIANHFKVFYREELRRYAEQRGILLIPGVEACVEGKHVLLINCPQHQQYRRSLKLHNLRAYVGDDTLIIAPHPFYPKHYCLQEKLEEHIDAFDAIEYAHFHFRIVNFNKKAVALATKYDLPLVGTSDTHELRQLHSTYSLIEAEKTMPAILQAVRKGRVEIVTQPLSQWLLFRKTCEFLVWSTKRIVDRSPKDECL